jgi:heme-degrading monooxygenase HmoA
MCFGMKLKNYNLFTYATTEGYDEMAVLMEKLAKDQDGFLGVESARNKVGITVSYWRDLELIQN